MQNDAHISTRLSTRDCHEVYRNALPGIGGPIGRASSLVARASGRASSSYRPDEYDPFDPADFMAGHYLASVASSTNERTAAGHTAFEVHIYDRGTVRQVRILVAHPMRGAIHARGALRRMIEAFESADPTMMRLS